MGDKDFKALANIYLNWAEGNDPDSENSLLARDVELEWFGQDITGRNDVANFIRANVNHQFNEIIPTLDIFEITDSSQSEYDPEQNTSLADSLFTYSCRYESSTSTNSSTDSSQSELDTSINLRSFTDQYQNQLVPCTSSTVKDGMFLHKVYSSSKSEENNITTGNFISYVREFRTMANLPTHSSELYEADMDTSSSSPTSPHRNGPRSTLMKTARKRKCDESDDSGESSLPEKKIRLEEKIESHIEDMNRQCSEANGMSTPKTHKLNIQCSGNITRKIPIKDPRRSNDSDVEISIKSYRLQLVYSDVTDNDSTEEFLQEPRSESCEELDDESIKELFNESSISPEKRRSVSECSEPRVQTKLIENCVEKNISRKRKADTQEEELTTERFRKFRIHEIVYEEIQSKTKEEEHSTKLEKNVSTE